jgi:signal-transduction protein with cAMP-binding, CBS, and nucleotidyltransferase domain
MPDRDSQPSAVDRPAAAPLFSARVRELVRTQPVICARDTTVTEVARRMSRRGAGSAVVTDPDGSPVGIVTDRDLRRKVVAEARDPKATRAAEIMSAPVVTVAPDAFAFEALIEMTRRTSTICRSSSTDDSEAWSRATISCSPRPRIPSRSRGRSVAPIPPRSSATPRAA